MEVKRFFGKKTMEEQLAELIAHLRSTGVVNLQATLKSLCPEEVPDHFRRVLAFYQSLSGPSRNFMYDVAEGRRLNKRYG